MRRFSLILGVQQVVLAMALLTLVGFVTGCSLHNQETITVEGLRARSAELDGTAVRLKGVFRSTHVGVFLIDETQRGSVRLQFDDPPESVQQGRVVKDDVYQKLFNLAYSIPNPEEQRADYEVELLGLVKTLKATNFNVYPESPVEIYPLQVYRVEPGEPGSR